MNTIEALRANIAKTTAIDAKKYLLEKGFYPEDSVLPPFFNSSGLATLALAPIPDFNFVPVIDDPAKIRVRRATHGWENYCVIHPFHYYHLVDQITEPAGWKQLVAFFSKDRFVSSYTLPLLQGDRKENGIKLWKKMEEDILVDSIEYIQLLQADIKSCYHSIYTHSIAWSLDGKAASRADGRSFKLLGNRLDKLSQNANSRQTNGLPIGPLTSDILAEIVLLSIDDLIEKKVERMSIKCRVYRYKDDYRVLCKDEQDCMSVLGLIRDAADEYSLRLNDRKTKIFPIVSQGVIRPWVHEVEQAISITRRDGSGKILNLDIVLSSIVAVQQRYPDQNVLMTFANRFSLEEYLSESDMSKLDIGKFLAQLMAFSRINRACFTDVIRIIANVFSQNAQYRTKKQKEPILLSMLGHAVKENDLHEIIWSLYLFRYFAIPIPRDSSRQIKANLKAYPSFNLVEPLMSSRVRPGVIFENISDFFGRKEQGKLADSSFSKQKREKVLLKAGSFSYSAQ